jgi:exopolysaccharide biosynthesis polyprenyl glycosylphosphotransferase
VDRADLVWTSAFSVIILLLLSSHGLYQPRLDPRLLDTLRSVVALTTVAAALVVTFRVFVGDPGDRAAQIAPLWILAVTLLVAGRVSLTLAERRLGRTRGEPTLIVGAGKVGQEVAGRLLSRKELGLRPVGFLDKQPLAAETGAPVELPVLGASWDLDDIVAKHGIRNVVLTFSTAPTEVFVRIMDRCEQLGVRTMFVPRFFEKTSERLVADRLGSLPLISSYAANPRGLQFRAKYFLDRVGAALLIAILSPLLAGLALVVLVTSGRPILYRQERIGRDGKRFQMLKLRTMRPAPEAATPDLVVSAESCTAPGGVEGVDRRTRLGCFMRKRSLDELPQLFNVLRGEMSFVGPRPERPEYVQVFARTVHRYDKRHRVKSGVTGWSQVNGLRGKTSVADRADWDNYYIENWSLWFDFKIALYTVLAVVAPGDVE